MHDAQVAGALSAKRMGICLARDAMLATRKTRDFDGIGIALVDPWNVASSRYM